MMSAVDEVDRFPALSAGVLYADGPGGGVVYDLVTETLSFLNPSAAALGDACRTQAPRDATLANWSDSVGRPIVTLRDDIRRGLDQFRHAGLVGRVSTPRRTFPPHAPVTDLGPDDHSTIQAAGVHRIRFTSIDRSLIDAVNDLLDLTTDGGPTSEFTMLPQSDGSIRLVTDTEWHFTDRAEFIAHLVTVVNDFVARTEDAVVLHAASMRSPIGATVVFPAAPGSGKSTLAAALTQQGWGYGGDESATIRASDLALVPCAKPILLDATSCIALDVDASLAGDIPVTAVASNPTVVRAPTDPPRSIVVPRYVGPAGEPEVEELEFTEALVTLVGNTLNLRYVGDSGLETLVDLAQHVPVHRITYRTSVEALDQLDRLPIDS